MPASLPADPTSALPSTFAATSAAMSLRRRALDVLAMTDPAAKASAARALGRLSREAPDEAIGIDDTVAATAPVPGRPARPELVPPQRAARRRALHTPAGRAVMIHALAHIEFNAINLALDAAWRFPGMPADYYRDWLRVADEEALHFSLLADHLAGLEAAYGDFPAHNSLWEMAEKTSADVLARMALVPRTLEARGLDASPAVRAKLANAGDHAAAAIIDIILRDEVGHVAIGNRWYRWLCARQGVDPLATYPELASRYGAPRLRPPFNLGARRQAGFHDDELAWLEASAG